MQATTETPIKLWIDDWRQMPDTYNQHAKTAREAIKYLNTGRVVEASFDFDLGEPSTENGHKIAMHVITAAKYKKIPRFKWAVHSTHPNADKITAALKYADGVWDELEKQ